MRTATVRLPALLLILVAGIIAVTNTVYVGNNTTYRLEDRRLMLHQAILHNERPPGGWKKPGANTTNIRILAVYLAQAMADVGKIDVLRAYRIIDAASIFLTLVLLGIYLRRWFPPATCAVGVLFIGAILPLTYGNHYFHPWDRPSLLLWLLTMWAIREDKPYLALVPLVLAVATKWDAVALPALYFMAWALRDNLVRVTFRTALLFAVGFSVYAGLRIVLPGGFLEKDALAIVASNFHDMLVFNVAHAPALAFTVPIILAIYGFRQSDHFARASALFGVLLFLPLLTGAVFREVRAEMMILVALLPTALTGFSRIAAPGDQR